MSTFVLDTSVLLSDFNALDAFPNAEIVLPLTVLRELDGKKKGQDEVARSAREVNRILAGYAKSGELSKGVKLENGSILRVIPDQCVENGMASLSKDDQIINTAVWLKEAEGKDVTLVSQDFNMQVIGNVAGLKVDKFIGLDSTNIKDEIYTGHAEIQTSSEMIGRFKEERGLNITEFPEHKLLCNQFVTFKCGKQSMMGWVNADNRIMPFKEIKGVHDVKARNREQKLAFQLLLDKNIHLVTLLGKAGTGKAQPLNAKIMTPNGYTTMGEIKTGDLVISHDGKPCKVLAVYPQGKKKIYKVSFSDGSCTECCEEHLWHTRTTLDRDYHRDGSVKELKDIMSSLRYGKNDKKNHSIPMTKPVEFRKQELSMHPYLLGFLLGDGGLAGDSIVFSSADDELINKVDSLLPLSVVSKYKSGYDYTIVKKTGGLACFNEYMNKVSERNEVKEMLRDLNLYGRKSDDKFIPEIYKYSSISDRIELLHGIMDTDGTVDKRGTWVSHNTASRQLADDIKFIVQSLGGTATISEVSKSYTYKGCKKDGKISYQTTINLPSDILPFSLTRKLKIHKPKTKYGPTRYIDNVEFVGEMDAQCIYIDHPDHLYLTDDFIVTHNTLCILAAALKQVEEGVYDRIIITKPMVAVGKDIGFFPGNKQEKLNPWMGSIFDNLRLLIGDHELEKMMAEEKIEFESLSLFRGRSMPNAIILIDEAQNLNRKEVKTIVTRAGENSKVIMTADINQIDNPYVDSITNGATYVIEKLKGQPIIGHITLTKGERSPLATLAAELL